MRYYDLYNVMSSVKITCFPAKRSTRNSPQKLSKTYIWHESRIQSSIIYKKLSCTYTQTNTNPALFKPTSKGLP